MLLILVFFQLFCFQIRDFQIAKREEDIGFYAGYVGELMSTVFSLLVHVFFNQICDPNTMLNIFEGSAFMLGRALTSVLWGIVADHYGRKPVIIMGTITVLVKILSKFKFLVGISKIMVKFSLTSHVCIFLILTANASQGYFQHSLWP